LFGPGLGGQAPAFRAAVAQPDQCRRRIGEDAALICRDHRLAAARPVHAFSAIVIAGCAPEPGRGRRLVEQRSAGLGGGCEGGMLMKPAIQRRRADREDAGEMGIVRA